MKKIKIKSFTEFIEHIDSIDSLGSGINLFRGQASNNTLLPSICRNNAIKNSTKKESEMLEELKRRSGVLIEKQFDTDWEWLIFAQHYGMKTRLLDWSSNPLMALWFACESEYKMKENSYVYILTTDKEMLIDLEKNNSPFENTSTKILRPRLNNERIVAQSGWFTAHKYSEKDSKFVPLESHSKIKKLLTRIEITSESKPDIIKKLAVFGVNNRTVFPDIYGLCSHMNWKYKNE
jgi:hypothetical protein